MGESPSTVEALEVIATSVADGWEQADTAREALPRARADAEALRRQVRYTDELKDELERLQVKLAAASVVAETQAERLADYPSTLAKLAAAERHLATQAEELERQTVIAEARLAQINQVLTDNADLRQKLLAQAEELERLRATTKRLIGVRTTITVNGKPTEVVFSPDDVKLLYESTTQGDQEP